MCCLWQWEGGRGLTRCENESGTAPSLTRPAILLGTAAAAAALYIQPFFYPFVQVSGYLPDIMPGYPVPRTVGTSLAFSGLDQRCKSRRLHFPVEKTRPGSKVVPKRAVPMVGRRCDPNGTADPHNPLTYCRRATKVNREPRYSLYIGLGQWAGGCG